MSRPKQQKATVLADILARRGTYSQIAERHGVPLDTVKKWGASDQRRELEEGVFGTKRQKSAPVPEGAESGAEITIIVQDPLEYQVAIRDGLMGLVVENVAAMRTIARLMRNEDYLRQHPPSALAPLVKITSDTTFRLLEAFARGEDPGEARTGSDRDADGHAVGGEASVDTTQGGSASEAAI